MDPVELFYQVDEFCKVYDQEIAKYLVEKDKVFSRKRALFPSEVITNNVSYVGIQDS